jgi:hypothetical protein
VATTGWTRNAIKSARKSGGTFREGHCHRKRQRGMNAGSENMKDAEAYLLSENITQYRTHPYAPKEKPFVQVVSTDKPLDVFFRLY